ncbi:MAG TPA: sugar O-acetyltransferase [Gemmataceae bacterium]|nr:sugar O-acetyltransferase [Gemmataceae bacterium]
MNALSSEEWSERRKMLAGQLYRASDAELTAARRRARSLTRRYNQTTEEEGELRLQLLVELFGRIGAAVEIEPPFVCDYGSNIDAGDVLYLNFGCVILDCARVDIGCNVQIGPGVHIYTAHHPIDPDIRAGGLELATPVRIGDRVWIGGGTVICPGVTIGDGATIGAGSVVVKDVPPQVVAAGNPCRILRRLDG